MIARIGLLAIASLLSLISGLKSLSRVLKLSFRIFFRHRSLLIALVRLHDPPACLALYVAAADVLAVASLSDLLGPRDVAAAAAKILAAFITGTAAVALPANFIFLYIIVDAWNQDSNEDQKVVYFT